MLLVHQEVTQFIMKRNTVKMSMGGPTGGSGMTKDQVLQLLFNVSGGSTDNGIGINLIQAKVIETVTAAGKIN